MWSLLKCRFSVLQNGVEGISPLRTVFHEEESVSSIRITPGIDDGAARGEIDILFSLSSVPQSSASEVMMDLQLACILVVGQLTADRTVWTTGGVLITLGLHTTLHSLRGHHHHDCLQCSIYVCFVMYMY